MGVALDLDLILPIKGHTTRVNSRNKSKSHPHPNPSPLKGEGLKQSVVRPQ